MLRSLTNVQCVQNIQQFEMFRSMVKITNGPEHFWDI